MNGIKFIPSVLFLKFNIRGDFRNLNKVSSIEQLKNIAGSR